MSGQPAGEWLDIGAASDRLGVSREALRKRIRRGTLPSEKRDGRWYVQVDSDQDTAGQRPDARQDTVRDALVEQLRSENVRLWEELEARREEIRRRDVLVAQQQDTISALSHELRALAAGLEATESTQTGDSPSLGPEPHRGSQRPWWAFWKRS